MRTNPTNTEIADRVRELRARYYDELAAVWRRWANDERMKRSTGGPPFDWEAISLTEVIDDIDRCFHAD